MGGTLEAKSTLGASSCFILCLSFQPDK